MDSLSSFDLDVPHSGVEEVVYTPPIINNKAIKSVGVSRLESLPIDIRWNIWENLGYPVGWHRWVECYHPHKCAMMKGKITAEEANALDASGEKLEHLMPYPDYSFEDPVRHGLSTALHKLPSADWDIYLQHDDPVPVEANLLWVNHFIRDEVMTLLLKRRAPTLRFHFELSNKRIYYDSWFPLHTPGTFKRMGLFPFVFEYVTRVTLTGNIGYGYEAERPHAVHISPTQVSRSLHAQVRTVRYLARNCPNLLTLTLEPSIDIGIRKNASKRFPKKKQKRQLTIPRGSHRTKQKHNESLIVAFSEPARSCSSLESITFMYPTLVLALDKGGKKDKWNWEPRAPSRRTQTGVNLRRKNSTSKARNGSCAKKWWRRGFGNPLTAWGKSADRLVLEMVTSMFSWARMARRKMGVFANRGLRGQIKLV